MRDLVIQVIRIKLVTLFSFLLVEMVLIVRLNNPIVHQGCRGHKVEMTFSSRHGGELQKAAERVFTVE